MSNVNVVVGVAGSGKTSFAMEIVEQKLREGVKWDQIVFSSFSRAACQEAARRASVITGVDPDRLQKDGWFRTIHSCAFRLLGVDSKSIIDHDAKSGRDFVAECCGMPRGGEAGTLGAKIDEALTYWDTARARLSRLANPEASNRVFDGAASLDKWCGQKTQQIPGGAAPVTGCHTRAVPVFFEPEIEKSSKFGTSEDPYTPIGEKFLEKLPNSLSAAESQKACDSVTSHEKSALYSVKHREKSCPTFQDFAVTGAALCDKTGYQTIIRQYEDAKRYSGMLDFTDLLFKFAGFEADSDLNFRRCYPLGSVPTDIQVMMLDEYQDCSLLLDHVAERLWRCAGEVYLLGDYLQTVYSFAGSDHRIFASREKEAKAEGKRILLNRSYRNPNCVIEWGEQVLREDANYDERNPYSDKWDGSVGLMEYGDFMSCLPEIATSDSMILCRTWFGLGKVKDRLDELCIPWTSCQEKRSSQWDSPVKIAIVLTMQALRDGEKISEQDFRRLTENFPAKYDGLELFQRGQKARWKKMECSGELVFGLDRVEEWGAGAGFRDFVLEEKWRHDQYLLLSVAMEKWGVEIVRNPRVKLGSCHSVKGMQAENVFCLATSSEKASQSGFWEDLFLKYVTITRASRHYRVVVDLVEHGRGRKLFLPCPKGYWSFTKGLPDGFGKEGIEDTKRDTEVVSIEGLDMDREISRRDIRDDGMSRPAMLRQRDVSGNGSQDGGRAVDGDAESSSEEDPYSEWDFSFGPQRR